MGLNGHDPLPGLECPGNGRQKPGPVFGAGYNIGFRDCRRFLRECLGVAAGQGRLSRRVLLF